MLCTPTADNARVSACLAEAKLGGEIHFVEALKICDLVLKNRQNTVLKQRIFLFVGSTVTESLEELKEIGRKLNKHQVAVSIGAFGDLSAEQHAKLDAFIGTVSQEDNSSVVYIGAGVNICDQLLTSPSFSGMGEGAEFQAGGAIDAEEEMFQKAIEQSRKEAEDRARKKAEEDKEKEQANQANQAKQPEVEKPKDKDQYELSSKEAERLAEELSRQEPQHPEPDEKPDDDKKKKDNEDDKETLASRNQDNTLRHDDLTIRSDLLTEKADLTIKSQTVGQDKKFMNELEELAQDDSEEELDGDKKKKKDEEKKKEQKDKEDKKKHQTEKHDK